jgi:hypothetical protein
MKTFQDYLTEAEYLAENPAAGDGFSIEIARDETLIETFVVDVVEDGVVLEADDTVLQILRQAGYLNENSNLPPAEDSTSPINGQKDARRYNFETSPDTDLEEQQAGPVTKPNIKVVKFLLGKKMAGDVKKSKVYVRGPKGNVVKVNFGDPNMKIKKSNPTS